MHWHHHDYFEVQDKADAKLLRKKNRNMGTSAGLVKTMAESQSSRTCSRLGKHSGHSMELLAGNAEETCQHQCAMSRVRSLGLPTLVKARMTKS
eukprot:2850639-Amphidinium_carterae.1